MEKQIEIHAYHGWGFDGSIWKSLQALLPEHIIFKPADRGYFGNPFVPEYQASTDIHVLFTHSYGLHWVSSIILEQVDWLVVFNGFNHFVEKNRLRKSRGEIVLQQMISQFQTHPEKVLGAFYTQCFHPEKSSIEISPWLNRSLLAADLKALKSTSLHLLVLLKDKTAFLYSGNDRIIEQERILQTLSDWNIKKSFISHFEDYGHALPIVNSSHCWSFLCEVIPIFSPYANKGTNH